MDAPVIIGAAQGEIGVHVYWNPVPAAEYYEWRVGDAGKPHRVSRSRVSIWYAKDSNKVQRQPHHQPPVQLERVSVRALGKDGASAWVPAAAPQSAQTPPPAPSAPPTPTPPPDGGDAPDGGN